MLIIMDFIQSITRLYFILLFSSHMKKFIIPMIAVLSLTTMSTFASSDDIKTDDDNVSKSYINKVRETKRKEEVKKSDDNREWKQLVSDAIQAAIKANNYEAFVKAFNEQLAKITTPTKEQFAKMVAKYSTKELDDKYAPIQAAIKANDYEAFVKAFNILKPSNITENVIPTKEEFAKMVEMSAKNDAVQAAIKANDYEAFVKAFEANKPTVPTKEEFAKMVTLKQSIKENKTEIKTIKTEVKAGTITKVEAKEKISSIKDENAATKKAVRLAKKPLRKVWRLAK